VPSKTARYIGPYRYGGTLGEITGPKAISVYIEVEFHDNKDYAKWIIDNTALIGETICKGICRGFGVTYKAANSTVTAPANPTPAKPATPNSNGSVTPYRVRKMWTDSATQKGAYNDLANAKKCAEQYAKEGYKVYSNTGTLMYTPAPALKILDATGWKKGENSNGILAVKRLMMIARKKGLCPSGVDNNGSFGDGTLVNVNDCLKRWGFAQNGVIGAGFVKMLADEVEGRV